MPFGVKDLEDCAGMPTSQGSMLFVDDGPVAADSVHVGRLRAAGAIPLGKTNAPEFGTLQYTRSKALGVARNPWDLSRTPGRLERRARPRPSPPAWCRSPRPATAEGPPGSRRRSPDWWG